MRLDDSFPASDPPSSDPNPEDDTALDETRRCEDARRSAGGNCALRGGRQDPLSSEDPLSTELVRLPVSRVMLMR